MMQQRLLNPELIHVAAAGEVRGRVVLAVSHQAPIDVAIDAALVVARAFDANLETLLIESPDALALAAHPFAREISHAGRVSPLALDAVLPSQYAHMGQAETVIAGKAAASNVGHTVTVLRASYGEAIEHACTAEGPWNIVARAESMGPRDAPLLRDCLKETAGATGLICVTALKPRRGGDVIVVVEDVGRLTQMVRAANRIAAVMGVGETRAPSVRLLLGAARGDAEELDGLISLALPSQLLSGGIGVTVDPYRLTFGTHAELSEALRKLDGCFVISRCDGLVLPSDKELNHLVHALHAPLLLVR